MATSYKTSLLASLTTAALAIPGIAKNPQESAPSASATAAENSQGTYQGWYNGVKTELRYNRYGEDGRSHSITLPSGIQKGPRYRIDVAQGRVIVPVNDYTFKLSFQSDSQTGGTQPVVNPAILATPTGVPNLLTGARTGCTVVSDRNEVQFTTEYQGQESFYGADVYYSAEEDTLAPAMSLRGSWFFNKNNTVLTAGVGVTYVDFKPTVSGLPFQQQANNTQYRKKGHYTQSSYYLAFRQDLTKYNYIVLSTDLQYTNGNTDDNYRAVNMFGNVAPYAEPGSYVYTPPRALSPLLYKGVSSVHQKLPNSRIFWMPMVRFAQFIPQFNSAMHLSYRYGQDDWGIKSHTFELEYHQPAGDWEIVPILRYYTQSRVKFYGPIFNIGPGAAPYPTIPFTGRHWASDYRLSGYGTLNAQLTVNYNPLSYVRVGMTAGYYRKGADFKWGHKDPIANPETAGNGVGAHYYAASLNIKL